MDHEIKPIARRYLGLQYNNSVLAYFSQICLSANCEIFDSVVCGCAPEFLLILMDLLLEEKISKERSMMSNMVNR